MEQYFRVKSVIEIRYPPSTVRNSTELVRVIDTVERGAPMSKAMGGEPLLFSAYMAMAMANSLTSFVEQQAGQSLRAIAEYERADFNLLYYRDDLQRSEITERVGTIHNNIVWAWNPSDDEVVSELGSKRATVQVREKAVIIHLLEKAHSGYLIGLEPDAARNLTTFLGECLKRLN